MDKREVPKDSEYCVYQGSDDEEGRERVRC